MSCVCKYDISVPCNDKSIYSCDMCKEHPMYEQGREDKYQEITSEYMLLTEKQVAEIRADAIEECIEIIKGIARRNCSHLLDEIVYRAVEQMEQLKEKKE